MHFIVQAIHKILRKNSITLEQDITVKYRLELYIDKIIT